MTGVTTMMGSPLRRLVLLTALALPAAAPLAAQQASRSSDAEFRWARAIRTGSTVRLANVSGDVTVIGADIERVELVATRRGSRDDQAARVEVKEHANGVTICSLRDEDSTCDERGMHDDGGRGWSNGRRERAYYDLVVRVPRRMRIVAGTVSGDVRVSGVTMAVRGASVSGDVRLEQIHATDDVSATTVSGDVTASLESVASGTELEMKSVSGDVRISMPAGTGLDLELSTVSGDLTSDFDLAMQGRFNRRRINAQINKGGSDLRVSTVSGDVRLARN